MNGPGKSDSRIGPAKSPNATKRPGPLNQGAPYTGTKVETPETDKGAPTGRRAEGVDSAEGMEGRRLAKGNTSQQNASRTQGRNDAPRALDRVRQTARRNRNARFIKKVNWVFDAAIGGFHTINHQWPMQFLEHRIGNKPQSCIPGRRTGLTPRPEVGARCGNPARRVLCGGRPESEMDEGPSLPQRAPG
jgi:hypothetical protein